MSPVLWPAPREAHFEATLGMRRLTKMMLKMVTLTVAPLCTLHRCCANNKVPIEASLPLHRQGTWRRSLDPSAHIGSKRQLSHTGQGTRQGGPA